jgi:hypothetical protein
MPTYCIKNRMLKGIRRRARVALIAIMTVAIACGAGSSGAAADDMKIRIKINEADVTVILADNPSSRDLVALLPLRLTLEDYGGIEKIGDLPKKLSVEGAHAGSTPSAGDVSYYAPWGNLAFFRKDFRYSTGLIALGKIESGLEAMNTTGRVDVLIERLGE